MTSPSTAECVGCGATFQRQTAVTGRENELECPECGHSVIRGVPTVRATQRDQVTTECLGCELRFPRHEAVTETKGILACPRCGSTDIETVGAPERQ